MNHKTPRRIYSYRRPFPVCPIHGLSMYVYASKECVRYFRCRVPGCAVRKTRERNIEQEKLPPMY